MGRAGASGSGQHFGEVLVARNEGFFLAGFAGWFVGLSVGQADCILACVFKGSPPSRLACAC